MDEYSNMVGYKVRLFPTKDQVHLFYKYFGLHKFIYNLCIDFQEDHYIKNKNIKTTYKRLSYKTLTTIFTKLKKDNNYSWLNDYSVDSIRGAIRDCCNAYKFYDKNSKHFKHPRYKTQASKKQFSVRNDTLAISENKVRIPTIGFVKYCNSYGKEIIGTGFINSKSTKYIHYYNPRISFDGLYFYLSFSIPKDQDHNINSYKYYGGNTEWQEKEYSEPIGIDVGLKNDKWLVDSTGTRINRPNSDVLNKKISRLQRKYNRQKNTNLSKNSSFMEQHPNGSKNMQKTLAKINKCNKKITNRRRNTVYEYTKTLLEKKPKAIVIEDIHTQNIINNHSAIKPILSMIYDAALCETLHIIELKMINNSIPVIHADPNYPSSQLCSCCGYRQNIGRKKIYNCPNCGTKIDRDLNAAINLSKLAY